MARGPQKSIPPSYSFGRSLATPDSTSTLIGATPKKQIISKKAE